MKYMLSNPLSELSVTGIENLGRRISTGAENHSCFYQHQSSLTEQQEEAFSSEEAKGWPASLTFNNKSIRPCRERAMTSLRKLREEWAAVPGIFERRLHTRK